MTPKIHYDQEPSGTCPVQAEGTINGLPFYFRARGRHWSLYVAKTETGDPLGDDVHVHREEYHGGHGDFAASYAKPHKCRQFIERAASKPSLQPQAIDDFRK